MRDVAAEEQGLTDYVWWSEWMGACYVNKLFFFDKTIIAGAQQRLDRLAYLSSMVEGWLGGLTLSKRGAAFDKLA